ncbi:MAG TPA: HD domain-containing protein, partial [Anaerolineae bacterium]|nr:HD domain-containing protein [Anaerolineae bacterium]
MESFEQLIDKVRQYAPDADLALLRRAYEAALAAHEGQARKSGEPYISHPVAVADILADLRMDVPSLAAALLHDVPEDTATKLDEVRSGFGDEISRLVDGVTKLERLRDLSRSQEGGLAEAQAENIRKIFLAMVDDIRVIMIKLADRLHNMRTLSALPPEKQVRIARETLDIYAPLANRLGIWELKWQLEDLALLHLDPAEYHRLAGLLAEKRKEREEYVERVITILRQRLEQEGLKAEVS